MIEFVPNSEREKWGGILPSFFKFGPFTPKMEIAFFNIYMANFLSFCLNFCQIHIN